MKFGKQLARLQYAPWERYYVSYKALKQNISLFLKPDVQRQPQLLGDLEAGFFYEIDREVEKVNSFLVYKRAEIERRLLILEENNKLALAGTAGIDDDDVLPGSDITTDTALARALLEVRTQAYRLRKYAQLNREGFRKIMKKYNKRVPQSRQKDHAKIINQASLQPDFLSQTTAICEQLFSEVQRRLPQYSTTSSSANSHSPTAFHVPKTSPSAALAETHTIINILRADNIEKLMEALKKFSTTRTKKETKLLHQYLEWACQLCALSCVAYLLDIGTSMYDPSDVNHRTLFHKLCAGELLSNTEIPGADANLSPVLTQSPLILSSPVDPFLSEYTVDGVSSNNQRCYSAAELLRSIIAHLDVQSHGLTSPSKGDASQSRSTLDQLSLLYAPDIIGRRPLHYAAIVADVELVQLLLDFHNAHPSIASASENLSHPIWCDSEGHTPMFHAVMGGAIDVVQMLIEVGKVPVDIIVAAADRTLTSVIPTFTGSISTVTHASLATTPLFLACKLGFAEMAKLLISKGANVNFTDYDGEAPLHTAVFKNHVRCVELLVYMGRCDVNLCNKLNGSTALSVAAQEGHNECISLLLKHRANADIADHNGLTPFEHAVFRAHHTCTALLKFTTTRPVPPAIISPSPTSTKPIGVKVAVIEDSKLDADVNATQVGRAYGHKYLQNNATVLVTLGSNELSRLSSSPVQLTKDLCFPHTDIPALNSLSLVITASQDNFSSQSGGIAVNNTECERAIFDLPIYDASTLEPVAFTCADPEQLILKFDLQPTYQSDSAFNIGGGGSFRNNSGISAALSLSTAVVNPLATLSSSPVIKPTVVGRATALLGSLMKPVRLGGPKETMGIAELPIMENGSMDVVGKLTFEFIVVRPFVNETYGRSVSVNHRNTYWKTLSTKIIGHRGLGQNSAHNSLQIGENTVLSMATAASLGAEYVEFDVQLTKDMVPVLYHDWIVSETGFSIPISDITLQEFIALKTLRKLQRANNKSPNGKNRDRRAVTPTNVNNGDHQGDSQLQQLASQQYTSSSDGLADLIRWPTRSTGMARSQSMSRVMQDMRAQHSRPGLNAALGQGTAEMNSKNREQKDNTKSDKRKNEILPAQNATQCSSSIPLSPPKVKVKGNSDRTIQDAFATLEDAFKMVPAVTGFNIEVKYPNTDEQQEDGLHPIEINLFIDTILECVYRYAGDRNVIFSSFHPQTCLMLNLKQPNYPVFFLTEGGTLTYSDIRCNSLREAVRFAKTADLVGIVTAADPIVAAPYLIKKIKESGLLLFTYGPLNNDKSMAVLQRDWGVDSLIVDSVVAIRKILQG